MIFLLIYISAMALAWLAIALSTLNTPEIDEDDEHERKWWQANW